MSKSKRIKIRLSINLSKDDLGLVRIFNEISDIENDNTLTPIEVAEMTRRHLLGIFYQYSHVPQSPFPRTSSQSPLNSTPAATGIDSTNSVTGHSTSIGKPNISTSKNISTPQAPVSDGIQEAADLALHHIGAGFVLTNTNS